MSADNLKFDGKPAPLNPTVGWTKLEPAGDSRLIYVSESEGSDENDGFSPKSAVKSITKATVLVRDGYPDWILLRRASEKLSGLCRAAYYQL